MAVEGIQNYVELAAGLTKATRAKARAAAKTLLATAGLEEVAADATDRVGKLAEEILAASKANRELMNKLVAAEVDRAAGRLGFVRTEELEEIRQELAEVRMSMAHAAAHEPTEPTRFAADLGVPDPPVSVDSLPEPDDAPPIEPIDEPVVSARKTAAKKAPAKKTAAKRAPAKKAVAKEAAVQKAPARKSAAKKSAGPRTAAQREAMKQAVAEVAAADEAHGPDTETSDDR